MRYLTILRQDIRDKIGIQIDILEKRGTIDHNNIIYVLDCHSFPKKSKFRNIRISDPEVTLLFDNTIDFIYTYELAELLKDSNIKVVTLPGVRNDIIDEFSGKYSRVRIISVLVEISETIDDQRLMYISKVFDKWINKINKYILDEKILDSNNK